METDEEPLIPMHAVFGGREGIWRRAGLVLILALAWKAAIVIGSGHHLLELVGEVPQTGRNLAAKGLFGNPFNIPTGPTAHVAPVCASIIGLIYYVLGFGTATQWVLVGLGLLFSALTWAGLLVFAETQGFDRRTALASAAIGAWFPFQYRPETTFSEAGVAPLLIMGLGVLCLRYWSGGFENWRRATGHGAAWGGALLVLPSVASLLGVALLAGMFRHLRRSGELARTLCFLAALAAVLAPWTWRNYQQLGALFLVRDNVGLELQVSNNDEAGPHTSDNNPLVTAKIHPNRNQDECRRLIAEGEVRYNAGKLREFKSWLLSNPQRFLQLTVQRFAYFWIPKRGNVLGWICEGLVAVLGLAGVWLAWRCQMAVARFFIMTLGVFPLVYYAIQADERYSYPVRWILYVGCGFVVNLFLERYDGRWRLKKS